MAGRGHDLQHARGDVHRGARGSGRAEAQGPGGGQAGTAGHRVAAARGAGQQGDGDGSLPRRQRSQRERGVRRSMATTSDSWRRGPASATPARLCPREGAGHPSGGRSTRAPPVERPARRSGFEKRRTGGLPRLVPTRSTDSRREADMAKKTTTTKSTDSAGWTAEERAAMKDARRGAQAVRPEGCRQGRRGGPGLPGQDRGDARAGPRARRAVPRASSPDRAGPDVKTYYGMPAYAHRTARCCAGSSRPRSSRPATPPSASATWPHWTTATCGPRSTPSPS